jgi:diguanylate cyclase (GGDEF)-like protein
LVTLAPPAQGELDAALDAALDTGVDHDLELDFNLGDELRRAFFSVRALRRPNGEISGTITCVLDVTDSARARADLERRATFDSLTGCRNREATFDVLSRELERDDDSVVAVVYVDLDNFKSVNDVLGHAAGDELLAYAAERLRDACGNRFAVGRLGGDEFLVVLREIATSDAAVEVASEINEALNCSIPLAGGDFALHASTGVTCAPAGSCTAEELVERADSAMYKSKKRGGGTVVVH